MAGFMEGKRGSPALKERDESHQEMLNQAEQRNLCLPSQPAGLRDNLGIEDRCLHWLLVLVLLGELDVTHNMQQHTTLSTQD